MKKFISKIRKKRLKGNVSLLVIFILLASSVISLLSINQIQRLLTYGNLTFNYFRSFYLAKAGTELGLVEVYNSLDGFNDKVYTGDDIVTNNLVGIYTGFNPNFEMAITGSFKNITNDIRDSECEGDNKIKLAPGAGIMLSLFSDNTKGLTNIISDKKVKDLGMLGSIENLSLDGKSPSDKKLTFAIFAYGTDEEGYEIMKDIVVRDYPNLSGFFEDLDVVSFLINYKSIDKKYLTIKNPSTSSNDVEFCIKKGGDFIPYSDSIITVKANYGDMEVGLQSIVKKGVPDWTLNVLDELPGSN